MSWENGISIATRERCGVCHKVSPVGFHVPNDVWERAVPDYFRETVLCVPCFTSFADERMVAWDDGIEFYPVSLRTHLGDDSKKTGAGASVPCGWSRRDEQDGGEWIEIQFADGKRVKVYTEKPLVFIDAEEH